MDCWHDPPGTCCAPTDWIHVEHHYLSTSERYHRLTLQDITHHEIYLEHARAVFLGMIQKMREE